MKPPEKITPNTPISVKNRYSYQYLDIPVRIKYDLLIDRIKLYGFTGLSSNIFLRRKITSTYEYENGETKTKTSSHYPEIFRPFNFQYLLGLGLKHSLNKNLMINFEPIGRISFTSIVKAPTKGYLYSFGGEIGVYYKF